MTSYQETFADTWAKAAERRDQVADERDRVADQRDRVADERDLVAAERETLADQREHAADEREKLLDERELRLDKANRISSRSRLLQERVMAADPGPRERVGRAMAALGRIEAAQRRDAAAYRRYEAAQRRGQAARRRATATVACAHVELGYELARTMSDLRRRQQQEVARSRDTVARAVVLRGTAQDTGQHRGTGRQRPSAPYRG